MSASHESHDENRIHGTQLGMLLIGGLMTGTGLLNLYFSFGWVGGDFNSDFSQVGFSGLDEIGLLPTSTWAIPLVVLGALMMVIANATSWRQTDGS